MSRRPRGRTPLIRVLAYGPSEMTEGVLENLQLVAQFPHAWPVTWVSVNGLGDFKAISYLAELFGLHPLALEDVLSSPGRPGRTKVDQYGSHLFVVASVVEHRRRVQIEQFSLVLGENFVITFQEGASACFDPVRERIRNGMGSVRRLGADYLAYSLLDALIDGFFPVLERYSDEIERLEEESMNASSNITVAHIHKLRHELLTMRRAVWPMRDVIQVLVRESSHLVKDETRIYLRDCYDHATQVSELVDTYRDFASGVVDVYLSSANTRMNEIMKVLTIISTIFIPLGFVASLYGMNFDTQASPLNMPELRWRYGYVVCLVIMASIAGGLILYFWRRGWFGRVSK